MKKLIAALAALMIMVCGCTAVFAEQATCTREEAVKLALNYAGLKENQVTLTKANMDRENGRQVWEIEFFCNGIEYDFDVDILTGRILNADRDWDHDRDWDDDWNDRNDWDDWFDFD